MSLSKIKKEAKILCLFILLVCFLLQVELRAAEQTGPDWSKGVVEYAMLEGHKQGIVSAVFSPDGKYLTLANRDFHANIWSVSSGKSLALLKEFNEWPGCVAFSPDSQFLATGDYGKVRVWKVPSGKLVRTFEGHKYWVSKLAFSPDGRFLATGSADEFTMWNTETGKKLQTIAAHTKGLTCIAFNPEGTCLVTTSMDNTAKLWRIKE
ncbi:MAG: WD40 repeat domain-containing protein [Candidatus Aminicenantes bacterium]|nr:WD40 repeat domain-containing protein [Candidatus Aminicenantes bacterium]